MGERDIGMGEREIGMGEREIGIGKEKERERQGWEKKIERDNSGRERYRERG